MADTKGYYRLYWAGTHGWFLDVPTPVTTEQLHRIAQWALPKQIDRYRSLPLGDRKDELGRAIDALKANQVKQRLVDHDRDGVTSIFASTERTTTKEYSIG